GEIPDIYQYDNIPEKLRVQIVYIWEDFLVSNFDRLKYYTAIAKILRKEYGVFHLHSNNRLSFPEEVIHFFLEENDFEKVLDVIELSFRAVRGDEIAELNERFKEHGIGYEYSNGEIIRIDSQLIHAEAVKPALMLLGEKEYAGAQQEFLTAYGHYRKGNHKEALNEASKAFESTMKIICDKRRWSYSPKDASKGLIEVCCKNGLVPDFWQANMSGLRSLLEGGVPTGRNKLGAHGQGALPIVVPEHIVSYILHMTASAIVFLVKAEQNL
ncbi:MAG: hypothetical protein AABY45_00300, partial [Deltaproteobacteria bacterium]